MKASVQSIAALAASWALPVWAAPQAGEGIAMPLDVSTNGWRIDSLIDITIVLTGILFVIMVVWMFWACLAHGRKHASSHNHGDSRKSILAKAAVSGLIFLGVDGNLFVNSTLDLEHEFWNFEKVERDPRTLRVEINARQWAWQARYAGPDGKFNTPDDAVVLNDIRVPAGTPVLLQLGAADVLHSLYIPNLRIKQDIVPGNINRAWFEAKQTGEFEIACAQHCGVGHYKMRGLLTVLPANEFDAWLGQVSRDSARAYDPADKVAHWGWDWEPLP